MASEQLEATIAMMRELQLFSGDLDADRAAMGGSGAGIPDDIDHTMVVIAGQDAAWIAGGRSDAAVLYLHGGGYVMGGISTHGPFGARIAADVGAPVLVLDYRLGPEHPHPAALEDALAAFDWLVTEQGIAAEQIVVAGDSAGGGLTIATLAALRDRGTAPAAGIALSPWADLTCSSGTYDTLAEADPLVGPHALRTYAAAYAGDTPLDDPRLSPLHGDLSGMAPLLVQVGGQEVLLDDSLSLVEKVQAAGGAATLQRWDEGIHVFQMLGAPESDEAIAKMVAFAHQHLS